MLAAKTALYGGIAAVLGAAIGAFGQNAGAKLFRYADELYANYTNEKVIYVWVRDDIRGKSLVGVTIRARDANPEVTEILDETLSNFDGRAKLENISTTRIWIQAEFIEGNKKFRYQEGVEVKQFPFSLSIPNEDPGKGAWEISELQIGSTMYSASIDSTAGRVANQSNQVEPDPSWLKIALGEVGTTEIKGVESNSRVEEYLSATTVGTAVGRVTDDIPWACAFVSWVFEQDGRTHPHSARCADWLFFGEQIAEAKRGAVAVFERSLPETRSGFVGFVLGSDRESIQIVGGNINDSVQIRSVPKASLRAFRWPSPGRTDEASE